MRDRCLIFCGVAIVMFLVLRGRSLFDFFGDAIVIFGDEVAIAV
jgi:hypothetical protein